MSLENLSGKILYNLAVKYLCEHFLSAYENPHEILAAYLQPNHEKGILSLNQIYEHIMFHAQNKGNGGNAIRAVFGTYDTPRNPATAQRWNETWQTKTRPLLKNFDPHAMATKTIYELFTEIEPLVGRPGYEPTHFIYVYCVTAIQAARFLRQYPDGQAFYAAVDENPNAFIELLQEEITGIGPALARDLLKELGYPQFVKPDVHIIEICRLVGFPMYEKVDDLARFLIDLAQKDQISPYALDRLLWLIGSLAFFYHQNDEQLKNISRNKKAIAPRREHFANYVRSSLLTMYPEASL